MTTQRRYIIRSPQIVKAVGYTLLVVFGLLCGASQVAAFPPGPSASDDPGSLPIALPVV